MANNPFDREVINAMERPLSTDHNTEFSYADYALRYFLMQLYSMRAGPVNDVAVPIPTAAGGANFLGAGYKVRPVGSGAMQVQLDPGLGFYNDGATATFALGGVVGVNDLAVVKPLVLSAKETIAVPTANAVNPRIDIIEVTLDRYLTDPSSRDIFNPTATQFLPNLVNKTISYSQAGRSTVNASGSINYKTGTPAATPVAPAVDPGYVKIAEIDVRAGVTAVRALDIRDYRLMASPGGRIPFSFRVTTSRVAGVGFSGTFPAISRAMIPPGMLVGAQIPSLPQAATGAGDVQLFFICGGNQNLPVCSIDVSAQNYFNFSPNAELLVPAQLTPVPRGVPFSGTGFMAMATPFFAGASQPCVEMDLFSRVVQGGVTATSVSYDIDGYIPC